MKVYLYGLSAAMMFALALPADAQQRTRHVSRDAEREDARGIDTTVAFARGGTVSLTIRGGEVVVTGWDKDEVRVRARSEDGAVRFGATSTRVTVELDGYRRGADAHFEINVPEGTRVSARSQTGDITIRGTKGQVEAGTQSGEIVIADVNGRVDVNTLSGDIDISNADGDAEIKTVNGDVKISKMKGDVEVESVSGDIVIEGAVSRFVRVRTTGGDVSYDGSIDAQGRYELASHSGDIDISVPPKLGAQINVSTWSGTVESDFPMTLKPGEHGIGSASAKRFTFEVGNGAARISLESFSGDITINSTSRTGS